MKLPPTPDSDLTSHFGNIYRELTGGDVDVISSNGDAHGQDNGEPVSNGRAQGDFSEFLWMEHEDDYDQEVIRELEEEDMINYYFDLYQDSLQPNAPSQGQEFTDAQILGDLLRLYGNGLDPLSGPVPNGRGPHPCTAAPPTVVEATRNHSNGEDLSTTLGRILTFQSTLNPNAPEFIPRHLANGHQDKQQPASQPPTAF